MTKTLASFILLAACGGVAVGKDPAADELKALAGMWKLVAVEVGGKAVPKGELLSITFALQPGGKSAVRVNGGDEFETVSVLDPTKTPKTIDIDHRGGLFKGQKQYGIYKVDGDRMTVCSTPPGGKAEDRPRDFDTKASKGELVVWERQKDDKKR